MAGIQRLFENGKDKSGAPVPVDMGAVIANGNDWIKAYVRTESGCFAFSDVATAQAFVGTGDNAVGTVTVV